MPLRLLADSLDEIPEPFRDQAEKAGEGYGVAIPDGHSVEDVAGLRNALEDERDRRRKLASRLAEFDGIDNASDARRALEQLAAGTLKDSSEVADYKAQLERKVAADIETKDRALQALEEQIKEHEFGAAARDAIARHNGNSTLLLPILKARSQWARAEDGKLSMRIVGDDGKEMLSRRSGSTEPMGLDELVTSLKADKVYMAAFNGSGVGGSGAHHASGGSGRGTQDKSNLSPEQQLAQAFNMQRV